MSATLAPGKSKHRQGSPHVVQAATRPKCGAVIERLVVLRSGVTTQHVLAVLRLRAAWAVGGGSAPQVQAALRAVGRDAVPLLLWVAAYDRTLKDWCALPTNNQAGPADSKKALGRLLFALDLLAAHYAPDADPVVLAALA